MDERRFGLFSRGGLQNILCREIGVSPELMRAVMRRETAFDRKISNDGDYPNSGGNMDFTKFLNSKDIAEYLREVHYEFSPEEAAYVIHEARNISLSEKHAAYRELIARYPEFILEERNGDFATQPLAHFLEELIRREEEYVAECKTPSHDAAYAYDVYTVGSSGQPFWFEGGGRGMLYPSYEMCLSVVNEVECAVKIRISKQYIARCEGRGRAPARRDDPRRHRMGEGRRLYRGL